MLQGTSDISHFDHIYTLEEELSPESWDGKEFNTANLRSHYIHSNFEKVVLKPAFKALDGLFLHPRLREDL